jgi:hypothetical protein
VLQVPIEHGGRRGVVWVRELRGVDEERVDGTGTEVALALLDALLVEVPGRAVGPGEASRLSAPDRDRLLAALAARDLGRRVQSTMRCAACAQPFDLDFDLPDLVERVFVAGARPDDDGCVPVAGGRVRLPTGEDELAAARAAAEGADAEAALLARCIVEGAPALSDVAKALAEVAPILDLELDATCPECAHHQELHFDIQRWVLERLLAERRQRAVETHIIARAYGWPLETIEALPRWRRRMFVSLIGEGTA